MLVYIVCFVYLIYILTVLSILCAGNEIFFHIYIKTVLGISVIRKDASSNGGLNRRNYCKIFMVSLHDGVFNK